jgi:hypothetical protein
MGRGQGEACNNLSLVDVAGDVIRIIQVSFAEAYAW